MNFLGFHWKIPKIEMSSDHHCFEFREYFLNPREALLLSGGKPVSITPKVFDLLVLFVENPGGLLEKEYLIARLWPDTAVEDSNLTYTIRQLRKTLGDDIHLPKFIQTVPTRGYRFICTVRRVQSERALHSYSGAL